MASLTPLNQLAQNAPKLPVTLDSRKAGPGIIFVAAKGATPASRDGHDFIEQAIQQGCSGLILENFLGALPANIPVWQSDNARIWAAKLSEQAAGFPSKSLNLCGVTGTNGKTTVTFLVASIAKSFGRQAAVIGTIGAGPPDALKAFGFTTPEAENLSPLLAQMRDQGVNQVAMEVSSHALATYRVDGLRFKAAGFTNLSQDHLDFHGDMESYGKAKMRLFEELLDEDGTAVLPVGKIPPFAKGGPGGILRWGYSPEADISASEINHTPTGIHFNLRIKTDQAKVQSQLFGGFNLDNMLCAAGIAYATGIPLSAIAAGLSSATVPKGRLERVCPQKPAVFVDFAHTPDALDNVLKTLREICTGKLIVVFGCGGDRDRTKRPIMAKAALDNADIVIATQDNPRHEDPAQIIADMALPTGTSIIHDRRLAIKSAIEMADSEDMVLIAGKGHETTQQIKDDYQSFDDAQIAYEILLLRH
ncbi:MAG: UDP-N-acetylmuramoyl-L-alanyl-D-glutamate--2,6-diaminopimelate ligase [Myxococcota bacterium]